MIKDLIKVQDKVEHILANYPQTRDSDKLLWLAYNKIFNGLDDVMSEDVYLRFKSWLLKNNTPIFESLSRARRKVQEEKPSLAGNKAKRIEEQENVKQWSLGL